jgi:predicted deacylase
MPTDPAQVTPTPDTQLWTTIDFDRSGKQIGMLGVPQSDNSAAWGTHFLPIGVVQNGSGPTALLFGGNHGDEYEGVVTLTKLIRDLDPAQVQGRIIVLPMLNRPAGLAGTRLSPLDGKNMNRAFPGERSGTITSMIAHYVYHVLFPLADIVIDIHSGGRSILFLPSINMHHLADGPQMQTMLATAAVWGAPYVFIYRDVGGEGLLPSHAEALGKITLGTELGSAAQFSPEILHMAEQGLYNVLRLHGILAGSPTPVSPPPQIVGATAREDYIMAPVSGIFEPFLDLGEAVQRGVAVGQMHNLEEPFQPPRPIHAATDGMVMGRRALPLTRQGDCVMVLVRPFAL